MRLLACGLALLLLAAATTARAGVLEETRVAGWTVGAYSNSQTGRFSHCATSVPYRSGISLLFHLRSDFRWTMGLANPQWRLRRGETFNVVYYIDSGPHIRARGRATTTRSVTIPLADSQALFETFRRGRRLYVVAAQERYAFNLTNSSKALAATFGCVRRYMRSRTAKNPNPFLPRSPAPRKAPRRSSDFAAEATVLAANVLSASGIPGFRIIPPGKIPAGIRRFDAVWISEEGLLGMVTIVTPKKATTIEAVVAALMALDAKDCKGAFSSGRHPTRDGSGVGRLMTVCAGAKFPEMQYTVAPRPAGGFYVLGVTGKGLSERAVLDAGTKLYHVALKTLATR